MERNNSTKTGGWQQINEKTRYKIESLIESGENPAKIAEILGYSAKTIRREIKREMIIKKDKSKLQKI